MATPDPSREAFEEWYSSKGKNAPSVERHPNGEYLFIPTAVSWNAWQVAMAHKFAALKEDVITANLVTHVGLNKHTARECERIVRQLLQPAAPKQEGST